MKLDLGFSTLRERNVKLPRCAFALIAVGLTLCTTASSSSAPLRLTSPILYVDAERISYFSFHDGLIVGGVIRQRQRVSRGAISEGSLGDQVSDCSDATYRCIRTQQSVFVVPRRGLRLGMRYRFRGATLTVLQCLRNDTVCSVAVVESDCENGDSASACESQSGTRTRVGPGPTTYFIFNADFGVTAFGLAEERQGAAWTARIAREYVLRGDVGLLAE